MDNYLNLCKFDDRRRARILQAWRGPRNQLVSKRRVADNSRGKQPPMPFQTRLDTKSCRPVV
eukprot:199615-Pyramimonas_sp.AAC.1